MEMEGRGFSEFFRNSSEEMFLKSWMENSIGMPAPTMEMLGFKSLSQNFRADSEELFKSWLTNGENPAHSSSSIGHRTRQASRRLSTEIANVSNQQHLDQKKKSNDVMHPQKSCGSDAISSSINPDPIRNVVENGMVSSDLYLAKAWFHSALPMTRSRSSELRKRYAAMHSGQMPLGMETMFGSSNGVNTTRQEFENSNCFTNLSPCEIGDKSATFTSPSNSSSSNINGSQMVEVDKVSSVVSMLKGTLERKKLSSQIEKETVVDSSVGHFYAQEVADNPSFSQTQENHIQQISRIFQASNVQVNDFGASQDVEGTKDLDFEGFISSTNPVQFSRVSQEPSQSESSAAAAVVSSCFDACDGPSSVSNQTLVICENAKKHVGEGWSPENGSRSKELRERIIDNLKDDRKRGNLSRYGSVTSAGSADKGDPTKKRRVERSRKMAEAKERNLIPPIPSDMQSVLKRCETLEKEVRSLKLNLSFMNRKDSEQTKQIEELQKQKEDLTEEKERLLEEIERIVSETS